MLSRVYSGSFFAPTAACNVFRNISTAGDVESVAHTTTVCAVARDSAIDARFPPWRSPLISSNPMTRTFAALRPRLGFMVTNLTWASGVAFQRFFSSSKSTNEISPPRSPHRMPQVGDSNYRQTDSGGGLPNQAPWAILSYSQDWWSSWRRTARSPAIRGWTTLNKLWKNLATSSLK